MKYSYKTKRAKLYVSINTSFISFIIFLTKLFPIGKKNISKMAAANKKTYLDMVKEAIAALKERTGSSQVAIKKWIISNYPKLNFAQVRHMQHQP